MALPVGFCGRPASRRQSPTASPIAGEKRLESVSTKTRPDIFSNWFLNRFPRRRRKHICRMPSVFMTREENGCSLVRFVIRCTSCSKSKRPFCLPGGFAFRRLVGPALLTGANDAGPVACRRSARVFTFFTPRWYNGARPLIPIRVSLFMVSQALSMPDGIPPFH